MLRDLEARLLGRQPGGFAQCSFELGGGGDIAHGAAGVAEQVVMVTRQVFGQLETGQVVGAEETPDDARVEQHREVAVNRALRQVRGGGGEDVRNREGTIRSLEDIDQCSAPGGEALVDGVEPAQHLAVELARGRRQGHALGNHTAATYTCDPADAGRLQR